MLKGNDRAEIKGFLMKNSPEGAENRGIVVILYNGFRNVFVNCKFTFYNILS
jgi:hypothetical protein